MRIAILFFISLISTNIRAQDVNIFSIDSLPNETNIPITSFNPDKIYQKPFFEDSKFIVTDHCSGEWGGSLYFTNKITKNVYECRSTCPLIINKMNNIYYITSTLAHLSGCWNLMEIKNPFDLAKHMKNEKKEITYVGDDESESNKGTEILYEKYNQLALFSFVYNKKLYHIVTDYKKTFIGEIINGEFTNTQTISDEPFYNYDNQIIKREDNHNLVFFKTNKSKGYLEIFNNCIFIHKY